MDRDFVKIAGPAFVQFAAEPIARVVDTAYLGRLGAASLGGAGAAIAVSYALGKISNDPLLRTSISLVAASAEKEDTSSISAALALAVVVGTTQALVTLAVAPFLLSKVALVTPASPMRGPALSYLRVAALGAPTATLWLVANGIFRGLGDTASPLAASLLFAGLNAILDPLFMFWFGWGACGAAAGTAIAQTIALYPLLVILARKKKTSIFGLLSSDNLFQSLSAYASAGSYVLLRSLGKITAYTLVAREASRLGTIAAAAHSLCFQLGVATSQICESFAVATQSLMARQTGGDDDREKSRHILGRGLSAGILAASTLSLVTFLNRRRVVSGLTNDPSVRAAALSIFPLVMSCQVLKGTAYPINGGLMGFLDWKAASIVMWLAQGISAVVLYSLSSTLWTLWTALTTLFLVQCAAGGARILSNSGPWKHFFSS